MDGYSNLCNNDNSGLSFYHTDESLRRGEGAWWTDNHFRAVADLVVDPLELRLFNLAACFFLAGLRHCTLPLMLLGCRQDRLFPLGDDLDGVAAGDDLDDTFPGVQRAVFELLPGAMRLPSRTWAFRAL